MKTLLRSLLYNLFCLYICSQIIPGFYINNNVRAYVLSATILTALNFFIKPLAKILFFPINLITLGLFSWVINIGVIWLLIVITKEIIIKEWLFPGVSQFGFTIPEIHFSPLLTIALVSLLISFISHFLQWLRK